MNAGKSGIHAGSSDTLDAPEIADKLSAFWLSSNQNSINISSQSYKLIEKLFPSRAKTLRNKNQNVINDDHIDEIFNTYQQRTTKDKYSYVATLEEIEENDFNLNIPRYVDTFEEETPIDLEEVAKEIVDIDKAMEATDATIADFCKQLGIATPF